MTGVELLARRVALKLRQVDLAEKLGCTTRTLMRYEGAGTAPISATYWNQHRLEEKLGELEDLQRESRDKPAGGRGSKSHVTSSRDLAGVSRDSPRAKSRDRRLARVTSRGRR